MLARSTSHACLPQQLGRIELRCVNGLCYGLRLPLSPERPAEAFIDAAITGTAMCP